ncbi:hypothetical protein Pmani_037972 [Petrolisthes manimaculis]|uniref:Transmembrane protein 216 n=1 Tax=Petrolisthes manimaculis TaxID=1843537 RepID=A0AAE1TKY8_9EUCA|nr:hypothetical protein Pmani_037972 [Petrolisthes manimaculis]
MLPTDTKSSLAYQILLYLSGWFLAAFVLIEVAVLVYKCSVLPYPVGNIAAESLLLIFLGLVEWVRVGSGKRGNLTGRTLPLLISLAFSAPCILAFLYLLLWQTYVLRLEVVLVGFGLALEAMAILLGGLTLVAVGKSTTY